MSAADGLTLVTALCGVALLGVLIARTVLKELAVGRKSTDSASARTGHVRLLDMIALGLAVLTVAGAVWRIVVGLTSG
ncbi:MAG TPA: hypothetical protein VJ870_14925 [Amycolatopsis sp.]|nr:hypothetical protein [Amycolatopsis sp.]